MYRGRKAKSRGAVTEALNSAKESEKSKARGRSEGSKQKAGAAPGRRGTSPFIEIKKQSCV